MAVKDARASPPYAGGKRIASRRPDAAKARNRRVGGVAEPLDNGVDLRLVDDEGRGEQDMVAVAPDG